MGAQACQISNESALVCRIFDTMNKAKALLDSLMGPSRDVAKKDKKNDEFLEKKVCKQYLIGCCPHAVLGPKLEAIRQNPADFCVCEGVIFDRPSCLNPDGCSKLHSQGLKEQFKQHQRPRSIEKIGRRICASFS